MVKAQQKSIHSQQKSNQINSPSGAAATQHSSVLSQHQQQHQHQTVSNSSASKHAQHHQRLSNTRAPPQHHTSPPQRPTNVVGQQLAHNTIGHEPLPATHHPTSYSIEQQLPTPQSLGLTFPQQPSQLQQIHHHQQQQHHHHHHQQSTGSVSSTASTNSTQQQQKKPPPRTKRRNVPSYVKDRTRRICCFSKRKQGILKKAQQLHVLSDCHIMVMLVTKNSDRIYSYTSRDFDKIISDKRFNNLMKTYNISYEGEKHKKYHIDDFEFGEAPPSEQAFEQQESTGSMVQQPLPPVNQQHLEAVTSTPVQPQSYSSMDQPTTQYHLNQSPPQNHLMESNPRMGYPLQRTMISNPQGQQNQSYQYYQAGLQFYGSIPNQMPNQK